MTYTGEDAEDIAIHAEMLLDDEMQAHACVDKEAHDLPFQIFRVLGGYREALDELASLRAALAEKTAQVEQYRATVEEVARQRNDAREQAEGLREALQRIMLHRFSRSVGWEQLSENMRVIAREALAATADTPRPTCTWTYDDDTDSWDSACGEKWQFTDGGPEENGVKFCHGCGRPVQV